MLVEQLKAVTGGQLRPEWPTCDHENRDGQPCTGIRADRNSKCLAHLDSSQLDQVLAQLHPGSDIDVRGTVLSEHLLSRIIDAVRASDHLPVFGSALFKGATFSGDARFSRAKSHGAARFQVAVPGEGTYSVDRSTGNVICTPFSDLATDTHGAMFTGDASFQNTIFNGDVSFFHATFGGVTDFYQAIFNGDASFQNTTFNEDADFNGATISRNAPFHKARFQAAEQFGPLTAVWLSLERAVFSQRLVIEVTASGLDCAETRFEAGVRLRLRYARTNLERAAFSKPSTITAVADPFTNALTDADAALDANARARPTPMLESLRGVDVADLVVTDIDMSHCRFDGAHHLDKLRLEGDCQFSRPPNPVQFGRAWLPVWRWTRRQALAEECIWRLTTPKASGWPGDLPQQHFFRRAPSGPPLHPKRVATLYRQLRKAQEDGKNEPGAADFYYGEMEMRRNGADTAAAERFILHLYWLVSGYGLRALRALICLAILITVVTIGFQQVGFAGAHPVFGDCLLYVSQSTVSLENKLASLPNHLTWQGEVMRLIMRVAGPILLGLALLAARNRVKR